MLEGPLSPLKETKMTLTKTATLQPIPYLSFNGNCREAIDFYKDLFGGRLISITTFGETPMAGAMKPEELNNVVNAQLELPGGPVLMAGDAPSMYPYQGVQGVTICLNFDTVEEAEEAFNALAVGGQITMPFSDAFWAKKFGMVTDRFGVPWVLNGELIQA